MIRDICRDESFLAIPSEPATAADLETGRDLLDTLAAHRDTCVGMAANMIGVNRRIIVFADGKELCIMYNPRIIRRSERYEAEEGCLSLTGTRKAVRWQKIKVEYETAEFRKRWKTYSGYTAEIIQHEIDHCDGILI